MDVGEPVGDAESGPAVSASVGATSERSRPPAAADTGATGGASCKITGCEEMPKATRGRYAYLCSTHIESVKAARQPSRSSIGEQAADEPDGGRMAAWSKEEIIAAIQRWNAEYGSPPTANEWAKRTVGFPSASTVAKHFGSWASGIEAAGFPRPVRGGHTSNGQQPPVVWRVKVDGTGLKYRTADEAYVAADEIEADGERVADGLRHDGDEVKAEKAVDAAHAVAEKIRDAAAAAEGVTREPEPEPLEHDRGWAIGLLEQIQEEPFALTVDEPLPEHGMRLMQTLGVQVVVRQKPAAPEPEPEPEPAEVVKTVEGLPPGTLDTLTVPPLRTLEDPEKSEAFVEGCETLAGRYETAAAALRQIVAGVRTLEELSRQ